MGLAFSVAEKRLQNVNKRVKNGTLKRLPAVVR